MPAGPRPACRPATRSRAPDSVPVRSLRISPASALSLSSIPAVPRPCLSPTTTSLAFDTVVVTPSSAALSLPPVVCRILSASASRVCPCVSKSEISVGSLPGIVDNAAAWAACAVPARMDKNVSPTTPSVPITATESTRTRPASLLSILNLILKRDDGESRQVHELGIVLAVVRECLVAIADEKHPEAEQHQSGNHEQTDTCVPGFHLLLPDQLT